MSLVTLLLEKEILFNMKLFIAGTDTEIGKTYISTGILQAFNQRGLSTLGCKPIATGCVWQQNQLRNEDAVALQRAASIKLPYHRINPFAFEPPIAPHIAANQNQQLLSVQTLNEKMDYALNYPADVCLIEGVGGWYVPLNERETMADFVIAQQLKVILVIGIRLGCINHSLLTFRAMQHDGVEVIGWVANCIHPDMDYCYENISTLQNWLPIPCLGKVGYKQFPEYEDEIFNQIKANAA